MAYGMELVIGWQYKDWKVALDALDLEVEYTDAEGRAIPLRGPTSTPWDWSEDPRSIEIIETAPTLDEVRRLLRQAHLAAIREIGWRIVEEGGKAPSVVTPLGPRNLQPDNISPVEKVAKTSHPPREHSAEVGSRQNGGGSSTPHKRSPANKPAAEHAQRDPKRSEREPAPEPLPRRGFAPGSRSMSTTPIPAGPGLP